MMRLALLILALAMPADAACPLGGGALNLEIPQAGTSGTEWAACIRRDLMKLSTAAVVSSSYSYSFQHTLGLRKITGLSTGAAGVEISSYTWFTGSSVTFATPLAMSGAASYITSGSSITTTGGSFSTTLGVTGHGYVDTLELGSDGSYSSWSRVLDINSPATGPEIGFRIANTETWILGAYPTFFGLYNNTLGSFPFRVTSAGLVGIGTASPDAELEVKSAGSGSAFLRGEAADGSVAVTLNEESNGAGSIYIYSNDEGRNSNITADGMSIAGSTLAVAGGAFTAPSQPFISLTSVTATSIPDSTSIQTTMYWGEASTRTAMGWVVTSSDVVTCNIAGLYDCSVNLTIDPAAVTAFRVSLFHNGVRVAQDLRDPVSGGTSSGNVRKTLLMNVGDTLQVKATGSGAVSLPTNDRDRSYFQCAKLR